jgi:hypothetical protein
VPPVVLPPVPPVAPPLPPVPPPTQPPAWQVCPAGHAAPQAEQFLASVWKLTQAPLHRSVPAAQLPITQALFSQICPLPQGRLQPPQWSELPAGLAQSPPQSSSGETHITWLFGPFDSAGGSSPEQATSHEVPRGRAPRSSHLNKELCLPVSDRMGEPFMNVPLS